MVIVVEIANQGRGGKIKQLIIFKSLRNKSMFPEQQNLLKSIVIS